MQFEPGAAHLRADRAVSLHHRQHAADAMAAHGAARKIRRGVIVSRQSVLTGRVKREMNSASVMPRTSSSTARSLRSCVEGGDKAMRLAWPSAVLRPRRIASLLIASIRLFAT